ncbi:MAG: peptidase E [bacterium]
MKIIAVSRNGNKYTKDNGGFGPSKIDKEIYFQTGKKNPKLLFVPTADSDSVEYYKIAKKHFQRIGFQVDVLYLINNKLSKKQIEDKILSVDVVYVGGGNTLKMLNLWRKIGVDKILRKASKKGIIMSGISTGAICWFLYGSSDSKKYYNPKAKLIKIKGLNFIPALLCPHYDSEKDRRPNLKKIMKNTKGVAIALEECCAIEIIDKTYRIISSKNKANVFKVYWKNGKYFENIVQKSRDFRSLSLLLSK